MMPLAHIHLKGLYETTVDFFTSRSPSSSHGIDIEEDAADPRGQLPKREDPEDKSISDGTESTWRLIDTGQQLAPTKADLDSTARESSRLRSELQVLQEEHRALKATLQDTQLTLSQRDLQLKQLREEYQRLEADYKETRRISEDRLMEVKSLEKFLTKTDHWSGAQLVQTVKDLSSELLQFSAAASEAFVVDHQRSQESPERVEAIERITARLGPSMSACLTGRDHSQDPTLLQIALQACASQCIYQFLSAFCFGIPSRLDSILSKIFHHMHLKEPQATSARWRALTHSHIRMLTPGMDEQAIEEVIDDILQGAANVLAASGYGEVEEQVENLRARFCPQLRHIAETAYKIFLVMREGTMSTDFQVLFIEHSRTFYSESMENLYAGYGPSDGFVLCSTELGVRCVTQRDGGGEGSSRDSIIEKLVILKPKVVLESVIQVLDSD